MDKMRKLEVVEYRDGGNIVRLFLKCKQDMNSVSMEVNDLEVCRNNPGPIYQISFTSDSGSRRHCHEYPMHDVARLEEEGLDE